MKQNQNKKKAGQACGRLYVGLDDHLKTLKVAIYSEELFLKSFSQDKDIAGLIEHLKSHYPDAQIKSVYEAGFSGYSLHRQLCGAGIDNIVVSAADVPSTEKEKRRKSDRVDCHKLGRQLRSGDLKGIYVPSEQALYDRQLVRLRSGLLRKEHSRYMNRLKMFFHFSDVSVPWPALQGRLGKQRLHELRQLDLGSASGQQCLEAYIGYLEQVKSWRRDLDRQIVHLSQSSAYQALVKLLRTIPGFGLLCSMIFATEIIEMERFKNLDHLVGYVGLVADTHSSGEREVCRGLTKRCNVYLRWALGQAAWIAVRKDPVLTQAFSHYCQKMPKNQAMIRIQKKLLSRLRYVWLNKEPYKIGWNPKNQSGVTIEN